MAQKKLLHLGIRGLLFLWTTSLTQPVAAETNSDKSEFVIGNIQFVLLHELAHLIVDDKNVPQLAPPEYIADYIAINMAISGGPDDEAKKFLTQALASAATSFALSWNNANEQERPMPYWDTHALGIQRYYTSICLLYGSSPTEFEPIAPYIPDRRRAGCRAEYQIAAKAYDWLLANYSASEETQNKKEPISFEYGPVRSQVQNRFAKKIRSLNLIENTVNAVDREFDLLRPLTVKMQTCRAAQASWQPLQRELIICYEMLDAFSRMHAMKPSGS
jgi:hypothetical protein